MRSQANYHMACCYIQTGSSHFFDLQMECCQLECHVIPSSEFRIPRDVERITITGQDVNNTLPSWAETLANLPSHQKTNIFYCAATLREDSSERKLWMKMVIISKRQIMIFGTRRCCCVFLIFIYFNCVLVTAHISTADIHRTQTRTSQTHTFNVSETNSNETFVLVRRPTVEQPAALPQPSQVTQDQTGNDIIGYQLTLVDAGLHQQTKFW